jgi:hypothetical protein
LLSLFIREKMMLYLGPRESNNENLTGIKRQNLTY